MLNPLIPFPTENGTVPVDDSREEAVSGTDLKNGKRGSEG